MVDCMGEGRRRKVGLVCYGRRDGTSFSNNHIDALITMEDGVSWRFTGLYGYPEADNKSKTGVLLKKSI